MPASIRVLIVSENRLLRETLARIFDKEKDVEVVGKARLCKEAIQEVSSTRPDVLLLNPATPALSDLDDLRKVRRRAPQLKVVAFGMEEDEESFLTAVRAGVVGYILKDAYAGDLVAAVRSAVQGEAVCPPRLCLSLFTRFAAEPTAVPKVRLRTHIPLTRRERELVPMIAQGLTNKEIASELNLSEQTVKNHVHRILQKAGTSSRLAVQEQCQLQDLSP